MKSATAIGHELGWGQRVLLVGGSEFTQGLRASVLRSHGLHVDVARKLADGRSLWHPNTYDWVLLDVHDQLPGEVIDFCEQLRQPAPGQRIAFFVGAPAYLSLRWPAETLMEEKTKQQSAELKTAA